jgi:hypothetical protein
MSAANAIAHDVMLQVDVVFDDTDTLASSNLPDLAAGTAAYGPEEQTLPTVVSNKDRLICCWLLSIQCCTAG